MWPSDAKPGTVATVFRARFTAAALGLVALGGLLVGASCQSAEALPARPDPIELSDTDRQVVTQLVGEWKHADDADRSAAIAAIELATEPMNPMIRGLARSRLEDVIHIDETLTMAEANGVVTITRSDLPRPFVAAANGRKFETTNNEGDPAKGSLRIEEDAFISRMETDQGGGERTYRIDDAGNLVIETWIFSSRLPGDIVYQTHYARP